MTKFTEITQAVPKFTGMVASYAEEFGASLDGIAKIKAKLQHFDYPEFGYSVREYVLHANFADLNSSNGRYGPHPLTPKGLNSNAGYAILNLKIVGGNALHGILMAFSLNSYKLITDKELKHIPITLPDFLYWNQNRVNTKLINSISTSAGIIPQNMFVKWAPLSDSKSAKFLSLNMNCTENRIINEIANLAGTSKLEGTITMYTDRVPCKNCRPIIDKFLKIYPKVKMTIVYSYSTIFENEKSELMNCGVELKYVHIAKAKSNRKEF